MAMTSTPTKPIDLAALAAGRFMTGRSFDQRFRIVCRFGEVIVAGDMLAFRCRKHGQTAVDLSKLPFATTSRANGATTITFPADQFEALAGLLQPRKRQ